MLSISVSSSLTLLMVQQTVISDLVTLPRGKVPGARTEHTDHHPLLPDDVEPHGLSSIGIRFFSIYSVHLFLFFFSSSILCLLSSL